MERKVAVVTGARRGIGESIAYSFAKRGYNVVLNDREGEEDLLNVVNNIKNNYDTDALGVMADLSKEDEVKRFLAVVKDKYGRIDVLVNNAGIMQDIEIENRSMSLFNEIMLNNVSSVYLMSKHFGKFMYNKKKGKIINISSINGSKVFSSENIDYNASKTAINSLTHDFALEYAPYVLVNAIAPGWVNTEMNQNLSIKTIKEETEKIYLKRFAEPQEIASLVCYLASDECSYINSEIINIDGGY